MSEWKYITGCKELPPGEWVVLLRDCTYQVAALKGDTTWIIGGHFAFDMPDVIGFAPIPPDNEVGIGEVHREGEE